jgi:hypothetical protein
MSVGLHAHDTQNVFSAVEFVALKVPRKYLLVVLVMIAGLVQNLKCLGPQSLNRVDIVRYRWVLDVTLPQEL